MKYQPKKIKIVPKEISELTTQGKKYTSLVMVNVRECGLFPRDRTRMTP